MYISSIGVRNLRCFGKAELRFQHPAAQSNSAGKAPENVTLLIGDNGSGKTTILKAIALAVLSPVIADSGYRPYFLIRRKTGETTPKRSAKIVAAVHRHRQEVSRSTKFFEDYDTIESTTTVRARGSLERVEGGRNGTIASMETIFHDDSPGYFLVAYGATRRTEAAEHLDRQMSKRRGLRYQRVAGLFEDYITLMPFAASLAQFKRSARLDDLFLLINELLPDEIEFTGEVDGLEPVFLQRGIALPFPALSDGYRAYIGLICDLLYHLLAVCPVKHEPKELTGIVMIDDIDLHLHPSWQRTVVAKLSSTLPRLQFIVTSHSPLVAGNLYAENIRVVSSQEDGTSKVEQFEEPIHGLNADQILTGSYFNLSSTRSPDAAKRLARLADQSVSRTDPNAAIDFLKQLSGKKSE